MKVTASAGLVLPLGSVCVADTVCWPRGSTDESHDQVPLPATTAVHSTVDPSVTVTVAPGSPVPEIRGVVSWTDAPRAGAVMSGAAGGVVSVLPPATMEYDVVPVAVLPTSSSAVTVTV